MQRNNILTSLFIIVLILTITSCHPSKKATEKEKEYTECKEENTSGNILGFKLGNHDNKKLYLEAQKWFGTPYRYGGNNTDGADCSGLVMQIFKTVFNIELERNSSAMMKKNCKEIKKHKLKEGDLVFFATGNDRNRINHVGIYLKENKFIHTSSSRGVIISSMDEKYYIDKFYCAGRVLRRKLLF